MSGWGSTKNRPRGTRKPKVRWEVLGLQNPLGGSLMTSMEYIRQQALSLANAELKQGTRSPTAERNAKVTTHAPDNRGATLRIKRRADIG
jgi:hypothetical protein